MLSTKRVVLVRHVPADRLPEPEADLKVEEVELNVELQPNQVLVKNLYLSMDPTMRSWMSQSKGSYLPPLKLGQVMRGSSVGRVLQSRSDALRPGQLVNCLPDAIGWQQYGVCAAGQVIPLPEQPGIPSSAWAGVLGGTGLTAYFGLLRVGKVQAGDVVLVSSAAGAVGSVVCQIAKRVFGCRVVGVAGGLEKCEWLVSQLGVDVAVDYKSPEFAQELKSAMKARAANVVFDNVGGKVLDEMLKHLSKHARVVLCGAISGVANNPIANHMSLIVKSASMTGFILFDYESEYQLAYGELSTWILQGKLQLPGEDMVLGLDLAPRALLKLFHGQNKGKLVVDLHASGARL